MKDITITANEVVFKSEYSINRGKSYVQYVTEIDGYVFEIKPLYRGWYIIAYLQGSKDGESHFYNTLWGDEKVFYKESDAFKWCIYFHPENNKKLLNTNQ